MMFLGILLVFYHTVGILLVKVSKWKLTGSQSRPWIGHNYSASPRKSLGYSMSIRMGWRKCGFRCLYFRINIQGWVSLILIAKTIPSKGQYQIDREKGDIAWRIHATRRTEAPIYNLNCIEFTSLHMKTLKAVKEFIAQRFVRGACLLRTKPQQKRINPSTTNSVCLYPLSNTYVIKPLFVHKPSLRENVTAVSKAANLPLLFWRFGRIHKEKQSVWDSGLARDKEWLTIYNTRALSWHSQ